VALGNFHAPCSWQFKVFNTPSSAPATLLHSIVASIVVAFRISFLLQMPKQQHYAVKVGKHPGVYRSWADCAEQVNGFSGAVFKKFDSFDDAVSFINDYTAAPLATPLRQNSQKQTPKKRQSSSKQRTNRSKDSEDDQAGLVAVFGAVLKF
jgi:hypothetical protein